jgi:hypothetical protein
MRVGTKHGTDTTVKKIPHRLLVACRLGMQIEVEAAP